MAVKVGREHDGSPGPANSCKGKHRIVAFQDECARTKTVVMDDGFLVVHVQLLKDHGQDL